MLIVKSVGLDRGVVLWTRQYLRYRLSSLGRDGQIAHGGLGRSWVSCGGGRSAEPQDLSAGAMERPDAGGNGSQHDDRGQPPQARAASLLELRACPARLHGHGRQPPATVAWPTCRRAGLCPPFHG